MFALWIVGNQRDSPIGENGLKLHIKSKHTEHYDEKIKSLLRKPKVRGVNIFPLSTDI